MPTQTCLLLPVVAKAHPEILLTIRPSGVAKVGNGWAQAQPIMSSAQPIFMSIVQPIYAPFHVKIYNK